MCRIGAIKSKDYLHPSWALRLMRSQQKGHDNSGFAMVMQDLGGVFENYKKYPILSMACTEQGMKIAEDILHSLGFSRIGQWNPEIRPSDDLNIEPMPLYVFQLFHYPKHLRNATDEEKEALLVDTRITLRRELEKTGDGYVYSFWPDTLTLKEIGDPTDIGTYFNLWEESKDFTARNITAQCRQNTNYDIVRYAAHPFFLQGYTVLANGENTFYEKNRHLQKSLNKGYIGFESDSQCFLYTLHYVHRELNGHCSTTSTPSLRCPLRRFSSVRIAMFCCVSALRCRTWKSMAPIPSSACCLMAPCSRAVTPKNCDPLLSAKPMTWWSSALKSMV